ncbi:Wzz/FepE/Etk N-terminal domain-containing protein [Aquipseudomonas alcaligenes]|uniref:Wzz/FepE/Etk N-terminal domain-containing protein n=1 Tax=Aquipseudomonas alcaligenes TaxID=43263 RepID=UPI001EF3CED6|nr:Wzz/FepE/Etk N-terminal domain-containing protein [Pseudomonas alcaligenes]
MNSDKPLSPTGSDEIDLVELFQSLWGQKWLISGVAAVVAAAAGAYAFLATPVYEVQSLLRPALVKDLDELNSTGVYTLTPAKALKKVGASLDSYETRLGFFQANKNLFDGLAKPDRSLEQAFEEFSREEFVLLKPDPKKLDNLSDYVGIQISYPEDLDGVAITNGLVAYAINAERERIAADFQVVIANRLNTVERQIKAARANYEANKASSIAKLKEADSLKRAELQDELKALRQQLRTKRMNRIAQLDESIAIAKSLGISKPTTPAAMGDEGRAAQGQGSVIRTEVNNQQIPLYFMGTETLQAERDALKARSSDDFTEPRIAEIAKELKLLEQNRKIEVLKNRKDEDLFLKQLAQLREEEARLKGLDLDLSALTLVRVDQPAAKPLKPKEPKKVLIIAIGFMLGGMLGVFVALIRSMLAKRSTKEA